MTEQVNDDNVDDAVDEKIQNCLNLDSLKSFFLFAGAGSGKTKSLVKAIDYLRSVDDSSLANRRWLQVRGKKVAVITFTKAARDEIVERTKQDPLVVVNTIHSFAWQLIRDHQSDIREWLENDLASSIATMEAEQANRRRRDTKIFVDTERSISSKMERLSTLNEIPEFVYNPSGDNSGRDSLSHGEVLKIVTSLLLEKPTIQQVLVDGFPVLLIDESQDTNRHLLEAILHTEENHRGSFCVGLLGDTMQRIYADGHQGLGKQDFIPAEWAQPAKKMNHRSRSRIVDLINQIRSPVDKQRQRAREDKPGGCVRIFIVNRLKQEHPLDLEHEVRMLMAQASGDGLWTADASNGSSSVKTLILEHHMAAARMGFSDLFDPLYQVNNDAFRTGLLEGSLPGLRFFCSDISDLIDAITEGDEFAISRILQDRSPLLSKEALKGAGQRQQGVLQEAKDAVEKFRELIQVNPDPSLQELLNLTAAVRMFSVPRAFTPFVGGRPSEYEDRDPDEWEPDEWEKEIAAWRAALAAPLSQARLYISYVNGLTGFDTHQGVKGLEFPRVMVVINDAEARGFLFSYDKLFGAKEKSKRDIDNETAGIDNALDRTRRLFYVTASRAKDSLAIVAYTDNPAAVQATVLDGGLFKEEEMVLIE